jgi:DNA-binding response OmpR family regulator
MSARVMVVDDEPEVVRLLEVILNRAGFAVTKAGSGQECLTLLSQQDPDVIILDVMMPGMTGLDVMRSLHTMYKAVTQPPVIFLSAKGGMEAMVEGLQAGAYKYLVKPASREKLVEVVRAALEFGENKRHPEVAPPDWM